MSQADGLTHSKTSSNLAKLIKKEVDKRISKATNKVKSNKLTPTNSVNNMADQAQPPAQANNRPQNLPGLTRTGIDQHNKVAIFDSQPVWVSTLIRDLDYRDLVFRNTTMVGGEILTQFNYMVMFNAWARNYASEIGKDPFVWSALENLVPFLPNELYLDRNRADQVLEGRKGYFLVLNQLEQMFIDPNNTWRELTRRGVVEANTEIPATIVQAHGLNVNCSAGQLVQILSTLYNDADNEARRRLNNREVARFFVSTVVAVCKRGTFSEHFIESVINHLSQDLGFAVRLEREASMKQLYDIVSMTAPTLEEVEYVFARWRQFTRVNGMPMRVMLLVDRAEFSGVAGYRIILETMRQFPTFNWQLVSEVYPRDIAAFRNAFAAAGEARYFGFISATNRITNGRPMRTLTAFCANMCRLSGLADLAPTRNYGGVANIRISEEMLELIRSYFHQDLGDARVEQLPDWEEAEAIFHPPARVNNLNEPANVQ